MGHQVTARSGVEVIDHDHGHWCNTCLRASGIRAHLATVHAGRLGVTIAWTCGSPDCTAPDITEADPDDVRHC